MIATHGLGRAFGERTAVRDLTIAVADGEIVALLGPNGAGKTTTLRMLAGLLRPSTGTVRVTGSVGLLTEVPGLWDALTVRLNLLTYARLHGLPAPERRVAAVLARLDLADRAADRAGELSKGLRQRVAIARTLLHDPAVLLLDEPTSGLDPASARHLRDLIAALAAEGRSVLLSTHNLAEAESLAGRIAVLKTRLLALDTPADLRRAAGRSRVDIGVEGEAGRWTELAASRPGIRMEAHGSSLRVELDGLAQVPDLVGLLAAAGARITRVVPQQRTLEDVYLELVEGA